MASAVPSPSRRRLAAAFLLAALAAGCQRSAEPAQEETHPAPVKAVAARALVFGEWTELLGTTQPLPDRVARVCAPFEGRIASVLKDPRGHTLAEGQEVKAGDVIAQLDIRLLQANRDEAIVAMQDFDEQKKQADYAVELADLEVKRLEDLEKQAPALVRQPEMKKARVALQDAESKKRGVNAKVAAGQARVKTLNEQIELSTLRAPIAGRIGQLQATPGQSLAVGACVCEIVDLPEIDVLCHVHPRTAAKLALGMPARFKAEGASEPGPAAGRIVFIAQQAAMETGNVAVKVRFPNPGQALRAGAVVAVEAETQAAKERFTVPDAALMEDQDPPGVVVFQNLKDVKTKDGKEEKQGTAKRLRATVGIRNPAWRVVEILALNDPETKAAVPLKEAFIIVEGGHGLHDDDPVKLAEEDD